MLKSSIKSVRLQRDIESMLDNAEYFPDVVFLVGKDKRPILANKCILSLGSPVFKAMFEHDTTEKHSGKIIVNDLEYKVMMELLRFLYVRRVEDIGSLCADLLIAADKYGVDELKEMCERRACKQVDRENVLPLLELATLCRAELLIKLCAEFIVEHQATICASPEFQQLSPTVARELSAIYAKQLYDKKARERSSSIERIERVLVD